ncbi:MAG: ankyrin repeat domain-containing protein [Geminicoccaceae bacterium]|nr:ankyrin repeat domain-containing protein [Dokdonella sp.]
MFTRLLVPFLAFLLVTGCQTPPTKRIEAKSTTTPVTPAALDAEIADEVRISDCRGLAAVLARAHDLDFRSHLSAPLLQAAHQGSDGCVRQLLDAGADANSSLPDGSTALLLAARQGNVDVVDHLLSAGAEVNRANRAGVAPLAGAAGAGQSAALARLIESGADLNQMSIRGWSALHNAIGGCHVQSAKQLLEAGANADVQLDHGATPLILSAAVCEPTVALLLDSGAMIDRSEAQGMTPLMVAAQNGKSKTVAQLLARGANAGLRDRRGRDYHDWESIAGAPAR